MKENQKTEFRLQSEQAGVGLDYQEVLVIRDRGPNANHFVECVDVPGVRWITSGFPDLETRETHLSKLGLRFVEPEEAERIRAEKRQAVKQTKKEEMR